MIQTNADPIEIQRAKFQIKNGISSLKDYAKKMDKAILLIQEKKKGFDTHDLVETVERCGKLIEALERKENRTNAPGNDDFEGGVNRQGLNREEQLLLENWEDQMREIVS